MHARETISLLPGELHRQLCLADSAHADQRLLVDDRAAVFCQQRIGELFQFRFTPSEELVWLNGEVRAERQVAAQGGGGVAFCNSPCFEARKDFVEFFNLN